jgi:hypothetical protein
MVLVRGRGFASEAREERLVGVLLLAWGALEEGGQMVVVVLLLAWGALEEGGQMVVVVVVAGLFCYPRQP